MGEARNAIGAGAYADYAAAVRERWGYEAPSA
jgi:hypothetical protein